VRAIARLLALDDLAELPAAPCLSSRVETGIPICARTLTFVDAAERMLRDRLAPQTVRARVRAAAIVIELDAAAMTGLDVELRAQLAGELRAMAAAHGIDRPVTFEPYRRGSAFMRVAS
jgi:uncharacterized protein